MMTMRLQVWLTSGRMCVLRMTVWSPPSPLISLTSLDDLLRVEARRRLVENQHLRVVQQCLSEPDALPIPFRQLPAMAVGHVGDLRPLHHRLQPGRAVGSRHAFDARAEGQVVRDRHVGVERRRFRKVAGSPLGLDRLLEHVVAGDDRFSVCGRHVAGQHAHRRRLAGAVGSEEPENLPALRLEAHVIDGRDRAVSLREMLNLNHRSLLRRARQARPTRSHLSRNS